MVKLNHVHILRGSQDPRGVGWCERVFATAIAIRAFKYDLQYGCHGRLLTVTGSISPSVMIPEHRLANLFNQITETQINNCLYHNTAQWPSLYHDHRCEHDQLPLRTLVELDQHRDEVWFLQFSPDGSKLATASKDSRVYIYDTETLKPLRILSEHRSSVAYVAWSPDNRWLVSCSQDKTARLWSVEVGQDGFHCKLQVRLTTFLSPESACALLATIKSA